MKESGSDVYRDSYIRYLGYANEVGEAFRPLVHPIFVRASYGISIGYVCADAIDKGVKAYNRGESNSKIAIKTGDVLLWQMLASVIVPGFTINRITWLTGTLLRRAGMHKSIVKTVPTVIGLASIPFIIHPIDNLVDHFMDNTYRKWIE